MLQSDKRHMDLTMGNLAKRGELFGKLVNLSITWTSSTTKLFRHDTKNGHEWGKGKGVGEPGNVPEITEGFCCLFFFLSPGKM